MGRCPKQKQGPGEHKLAVSFSVAISRLQKLTPKETYNFAT